MTGTGHPPGSFVASADGRTIYHVQPDGSWRRLNITREEFDRRRALALAHKDTAVEEPDQRSY